MILLESSDNIAIEPNQLPGIEVNIYHFVNTVWDRNHRIPLWEDRRCIAETNRRYDNKL